MTPVINISAVRNLHSHFKKDIQGSTSSLLANSTAELSFDIHFMFLFFNVFICLCQLHLIEAILNNNSELLSNSFGALEISKSWTRVCVCCFNRMLSPLRAGVGMQVRRDPSGLVGSVWAT